VITIHQRHRQTDGRTDRQTTCDRNTALCTKVHRAVKKESMQNTSGGSPDNACRLGIVEVQKVPRGNRKAALAAGSGLERYDFLWSKTTRAKPMVWRETMTSRLSPGRRVSAGTTGQPH